MKEETTNDITLETKAATPPKPKKEAPREPQGDATAPPRSKAEEIEEERQELKRIVSEIAREDERPISSDISIKKILGGEFLTARLVRRQIWLILLIVGFTIIYISNRYSCDRQRIEISNLTKELEEAKFKAMSAASELTEISRESNVLEMLRQNKDSVLHIPEQPPYIINVPE